MFRANSQRNGTFNKTGLYQLRGLKWKTSISSNLSFTELENLYISVDDDAIFVVGNAGYITRLNSDTGEIIWQHKFGEQIIGYPTIKNKVLYVVIKESDREYLCVFDINNPSLAIWKFKIRSQDLFVNSAERFLQKINFNKIELTISPVLSNNTVYTNSSNGNLYAVNVADGREKWCFTSANNYKISAPAIHKDIIVVASTQGKLYAINSVTGRQLWISDFEFKTSIETEPICPAISQGLVVLNNGSSEICAFDLENGELVWTFTELNQSFYYPTVDLNYVYFRAYNNYTLYCLNIDTGRINWKYTTESIPSNNAETIVVSNNIAYIWNNSCLQAVALNNREQIWQFKVDLFDSSQENFSLFDLFGNFKKLRTSPPIIADKKIYFLCEDGIVCALN